MTIAMVFPGQGSQSQGMQADLAEAFPCVRETYSEASDVLGYDLWQLVQDGPAEKLGQTTVTQPAMLAAGVAAWRCWNEAGGAQPSHFAGHSLGEYSALVAAGAMAFSDAMAVVKTRSELMQEAVPAGVGAMAAILGLDDDVIEKVCNEAAQGEIVEAVNYNSPGQVVIAGHKGAVERAVEQSKSAGSRRAVTLPVSVPSHSSLMQQAGMTLADSLAEIDVKAPADKVIAATNGVAYAGPDQIRETLSLQVYSPVQWVSTINAMVSDGATVVIECGPGKVLAGLVRRINRGTAFATLDNHDGLSKALENYGK